MVIVDGTGTIVLINAQTERPFGYEREELLGQRVEVLVPERFREHHGAHREDFAEDPHTRSMDAGLELYGRRKDGTEFPVEISLAPLETEDGTLVSSAIRDITTRQREEGMSAFERRSLRAAEAIGRVASWEMDIATNTVAWSDMLFELYGLQPDGFDATSLENSSRP